MRHSLAGTSLLVALPLALAGCMREGSGGAAPSAARVAAPFGFRALHRELPFVVSADLLATGDLDGDLDPDVVVTGSYGEPIRGFLNDGSGAFRDVELYPWDLDARDPVDEGFLFVMDLDADGDADLLAGTQVYEQIEPLVFLPKATPPLQGHPVAQTRAAVGVGDFDADGYPDLFMGLKARYGAGLHNRLYLNLAGQGFEDASLQLPVDVDETNAVAVGDVDADGDLDVLQGTGPATRDRLYLNDGSASFARTVLSTRTLETLWVDFADVDLDGDLDAFTASQDRVRFHRNDGAASFTEDPPVLLRTSPEPVSARLADLDADGDPDAILDGELYLNDGSGTFAPEPGFLPAGFALGVFQEFVDLDLDGDLDSVSRPAPRFPDQGVLQVLLGDGTGRLVDTFPDASLDDLDAHGVRAASGDVDGDGDLDVWLAQDTFSASATGNRLLLDDGAGGFVDASERIEPALEIARDVALADVDGDGDLDAVLASQAILLNDGTGTFSRSGLMTPVGTGLSVAVGDLDGDQDPDVLVGMAGGRVVFVNDGTGRMVAEPGRTPPPPLAIDYANDVALGDVDGDGDLDAVLAFGTVQCSSGSYEGGCSYLGRRNELLLNDGVGFLVDASSQLPQDEDLSRAVALGDLDGDGDLDLVFGNGALLQLITRRGTTAEPDRVYRNEGGVFVPWQSDALGESTFGTTIADVDGDGDLDLVKATKTTYPSGQPSPIRFMEHRVLLNDGSGTLAPGPVLESPSATPIVADFDGDGDADLFGTPLWTGLARQVAWGAPARLGKPFVLEVYGTPRTPYTVLCAPDVGRVDEGARGVLRLDPDTLAVVERGVLDAEGRATVRIDVPVHGALLGQPIYVQALVGAPPRYTNLEVSRISGL